MPYLTRVVQRTDPLLQPLLKAALSEYDAGARLKKQGWKAADYFQYCDERAAKLEQPVTYLAVAGDGEETDLLGFARFTLETTLPGYQSLPGDPKAIGLDEIFVRPSFRGRGAFPVLVDGVRKFGQHLGAYYVYARVVNGRLSKVFQGYGLGMMPLLVGTLHKLALPEPAELSEHTGDWSTKPIPWTQGVGAKETGSRVANKSEFAGFRVKANDGGF